MAVEPVDDGIPATVVERVLEKLGFAAMPAADHTGLGQLYGAWCRGVPMDNLRKLVHLRAGDPGPLPGDTARDFFASWLAHGTGGTCWAVHGALTALLQACGFEARRGIGTMLVAPDVPPNHGTTCVRLEDETLLVDGCILHGEPLALGGRAEVEITHPAWGVRAREQDGKWLVRWRSPFALDGMDCRIDSFEGTSAMFSALHEGTRGWSPFNYELFVRVHRHDSVLGLARGERVVFDAAGAVHRAPLDREARLGLLVEELGISEEFARLVPDDLPTPPPPGSRTASAAASAD